MTTQHAESGGTARAQAAVVHRRIDTDAYEQHVLNLLNSIELSAGVRVWATVRMDDAGATLDVRAGTEAGDVTASRQLTLPAAVRSALQAAIDDAEDGLRADLKKSIARTLASAALGIGQET